MSERVDKCMPSIDALLDNDLMPLLRQVVRKRMTQYLEVAAEIRDEQRSPRYEALRIIAGSVAAALGRHGATDVDDPGEAIDLIAEERDKLRQDIQQERRHLMEAEFERDTLQARIDDAPFGWWDPEEGSLSAENLLCHRFNDDCKRVALVVIDDE